MVRPAAPAQRLPTQPEQGWSSRLAKAFRQFHSALFRQAALPNAGAGLEHLKDAYWELTEREARLRELLDGQETLIVRRDGEGRVVFANRAYCDAFAVSMREITGRRFKPAVMATEPLAPAAGQCRRFVEHVETSGGLRWILWEEHNLSSPARAHDTQCAGRDITDERRAAAELREARDAAELANRAKSRFLASMSHEIRTPMNGILGMASLLQDTHQTAEQKTYTQAIDQSARALLALIDEILDFSKIEAGKLQLAADAFSLTGCVRDALQLLEPKAIDKGLRLSCSIGDDVPDAMIGDPSRVRQIVLNLVSNAIKFTNRGSVAVTVRRSSNTASPSGSGFFEIVVQDTGIGISPAAMALLFVEFEQAESAGGHRQSGTGLGLAISKRLARAMGGDILVEGAPGKGAAFTALLRLCDAPAEMPVDSDARIRITKQTSGGCDACRAAAAPRVLIAEDNDINALLARRVSERAGCDVEVVGSGLAAVAAVERSLAPGGAAFDLILMDVFMPGLDGLDATRQIKALYGCRSDGQSDGQSGGQPAGQRPCPPIIALTANAFAEDRDNCIASGMDDYLAKPFDMRQLTALLSRWLPSAAESPD